MKTEHKYRNWKSAGVLLALSVVAAGAIGQFQRSPLVVLDPINDLRAMVSTMLYRQSALENALTAEIKARKDLQKQVDDLKKPKAAVPAKKG